MNFIEDYAPVDVADIRRAVGGRKKLRAVSTATVHLPDGRDVLVQLARSPSSFGRGEIVFTLCPACGRKARVLRIAPVDAGLICGECVRKVFAARYSCQVQRREPAQCADGSLPPYGSLTV